jgi:hypothetical protein
MKLKKDEMREARVKLNNKISGIAETNQIHDINQQLDALEWFFTEIEKHGQFEPEKEQTRGGWNVQGKTSAEKKDDMDEAFYARVVTARCGLSILQKYIPALKNIADRCLELAGKDAVRRVCEPGSVNSNIHPSEFTLPEGYGTLAQKIKSAIGG